MIPQIVSGPIWPSQKAPASDPPDPKPGYEQGIGSDGKNTVALATATPDFNLFQKRAQKRF